MSDQSHCEPVQDSFVDFDSSIREDDHTYNNGRWTDSEHRKFLEAIAVYGNKWDKVKEHVVTRSTRQIRSHAQKYIMSLSRKKFEKEVIDNNSSIEQLKEIDQSELESIIYNKFKGNSMKLFDLDMNVNNHLRENNKKVFMIAKFPKHKELQEMLTKNSSKEFIKNIIREKNEITTKNRIIDDILNDEESNEETTEKKIEELRRMSEVLQILNKSNKGNNNKNKQSVNNNIINRNNTPVTNNDKNNNTQKSPIQQKDNNFKLPPPITNTNNKSIAYPPSASLNSVNKYGNSIQNYFTSVNYNIFNNLLNGYPPNNPYTNQYLQSYLSPNSSNSNYYTASQYLQSLYNTNYISNPYYQCYMDYQKNNNQSNQ